MDEQLKRRLMGAAIVTALSVIFVPMLFEDKAAAPAATEGAEVPALPDAIDQQELALPGAAEEAASAEPAPAQEAAKPAAESGYRIVPLDDTPAKAKAAADKAAADKNVAEPAPATEAEAEDDEDTADDGTGDGNAPAPSTGGESPAPKSTAAPVKSPEARAGHARKPKQAAPVAGDGAREDAAPAKARSTRPVSKTAEPAPKPPKSSASVAAPAKAAPAPKPAATKAAPPAAKPKEAAAPAVTPPGSWAVQAGTFSSESNAKALAEKLRKQNLPATVRVSRKDGKEVYRVTLGPDLNRARAEQMLKQTESASGVKGMLVPHH